MVVFVWYLGKKETCLVCTCTVAYTEKVTLYKVPEKHRSTVHPVSKLLVLWIGTFSLLILITNSDLDKA